MTLSAIGPYRVRDVLGRGGMATVYRAVDPRTGGDVAVKLMSRELVLETTFRKRFEREAAVLDGLRLPGVVSVIDYGEHDGRPYLVMPCYTGGTLADRLEQRGPLPPDEIAAILIPIAQALAAAHRRDLVHRDVKPTNILFDAAGRPYLTDFGVVKVLGDMHTSYTQTGTVLGTPVYMSPEQFRTPDELDGRCDVYALGIVLFEMLTGRLPYSATNQYAVAFLHMSEPIPRLRDIDRSLPAVWQPIIDRAMAKKSADRYPTAGALAAEVARAAATLRGPAPRPTPRPAPPAATPARRPGGWLWAVAAVAALAVLLGGAALALLDSRAGAATPPAATTAAGPTVAQSTLVITIPAAGPVSATAPPTAASTSTPAGAGAEAALAATSPTPPATSAAAATPAGPQLRVTTLTDLRAGPSMVHDVVARLAPSAQVTVIGRDAVWAWYNVQLADGRSGWVQRAAGELLDPADLARIEPAATIPAAGTVVAPPATAAFATAAPTFPAVAMPTARPTLPPLAPTSPPAPTNAPAPPPTDPPPARPTDPLPTDPPPTDPPEPPPTAAVPPTPATLPTAAVP